MSAHDWPPRRSKAVSSGRCRVIQPRSWARCTVLGVLLCAQLGVAAAPAAAQQGPVQRGQEYYDLSRFDEAISLLRDLVDKGSLSGDELLRAREILARAYVKKGYPIQAREMFRAILDQSPAYRPDPIHVPPEEMTVYEQALRDYQATRGNPPEAPPAGRAQPSAPPATVAATSPHPAATPTPSTVKEGGGKKKAWWLWVAGAAVGVGVVAAVGGGGG
jgi:tetratricopeptide (TPR) repeat protein